MKHRRESSNIILYGAGQAVSATGTSVYAFATGLYILKTTGSALGFGTSIILTILPRIILAPIAGRIVDGLPKKLIVILCDLAAALLILLLLACGESRGYPTALIYLSTTLLTILNTFFSIGFLSAMPQMVNTAGGGLEKINSVHQASQSVSKLAGPVLGGLLFALFPLRTVLLLNGASFFFSAVTECFICFQGEETEKKLEKAPQKRILKAILQDKEIRTVALMSLTLNFFLGGLLPTVSIIIITLFAIGSQSLGIVQAFSAVGMLLGSALSSRSPAISKRPIPYFRSTLFIALSYLGMFIPLLFIQLQLPNPLITTFYSLCYFTIGLMAVMLMIPMRVLIQRKVPAQQLGRFFGLLETFSAAMIPLGVLLASLSAEQLGAKVWLLFSSISLLLISVGLAHDQIQSGHRLYLLLRPSLRRARSGSGLSQKRQS